MISRVAADPTPDELRLLNFLRSFGEKDEIQSAREADLDAQLKTVVTVIATHFLGKAQGAVIDIGCGHGILLRRLSELEIFKQNPQLIYTAVDDNDCLAEVQKLALELGLNRRLEPISLD